MHVQIQSDRPPLCINRRCRLPNQRITNDDSYVYFYDADTKNAFFIHYECLGLAGVEFGERIARRLQEHGIVLPH